MSQTNARANDRPQSRPLSPHLSIWKWGPHMLVSILHRACGVALATIAFSLTVTAAIWAYILTKGMAQ
jgi:succinate dehydrogenase/fumarate reductase cytochrome b subunit